MVRSVWRTIVLLRAFSAEHPRQTLTELSKAAALDKNTARRLLHTLEAGGLVEHRDGLYSLGYGLLELFSAIEPNRSLRDAALPSMTQIALETSATTFLWRYQDGMALCVERVRPKRTLVDAAWTPPGGRLTLNSGGGPLTLLAYISEEQRGEALSHVLVSRTPASMMDRSLLEERAARTREEGFVLAENDILVGLAGLGVPIFDRHKALVGALSITTSCEHMRDMKLVELIDLLKFHAHRIGIIA